MSLPKAGDRNRPLPLTHPVHGTVVPLDDSKVARSLTDASASLGTLATVAPTGDPRVGWRHSCDVPSTPVVDDEHEIPTRLMTFGLDNVLQYRIQCRTAAAGDDLRSAVRVEPRPTRHVDPQARTDAPTEIVDRGVELSHHRGVEPPSVQVFGAESADAGERVRHDPPFEGAGVCVIDERQVTTPGAMQSSGTGRRDPVLGRFEYLHRLRTTKTRLPIVGDPRCYQFTGDGAPDEDDSSVDTTDSLAAVRRAVGS